MTVNFTPRVQKLLEWLAKGNGYLEAVVVGPSERAFRSRYRMSKGRNPRRGTDYTLAKNAKIKGGNELRLVIPKYDERFRLSLEEDMGLAPLRMTHDNRGWRKSIGKGDDNLFYDLLAIGFESGSANRAKHRLRQPRIAEVRRRVRDEEKRLKAFVEGSRRQVALELAVRNAALIQAAKGCYPTVCCVCGFDFAEAYGKHGRGFIEAHHLKPVAFYQKTRRTVTVRDIRLVCANCHRMLHRGSRLLAIGELRRIVAEQRRKRRQTK